MIDMQIYIEGDIYIYRQNDRYIDRKVLKTQPDKDMIDMQIYIYRKTDRYIVIMLDRQAGSLLDPTSQG